VLRLQVCKTALSLKYSLFKQLTCKVGITNHFAEEEMGLDDFV
jgi:hypothetical protein